MKKNYYEELLEQDKKIKPRKKDYYRALLKQDKIVNLLIFIAMFISHPVYNKLNGASKHVGCSVNYMSFELDLIYLIVTVLAFILPIYNKKRAEKIALCSSNIYSNVKKTKMNLKYTILQILIPFSINLLLVAILKDTEIYLYLWIFLCLLSLAGMLFVIVTLNYLIIDKFDSIPKQVISMVAFHLLVSVVIYSYFNFMSIHLSTYNIYNTPLHVYRLDYNLYNTFRSTQLYFIGLFECGVSSCVPGYPLNNVLFYTIIGIVAYIYLMILNDKRDCNLYKITTNKMMYSIVFYLYVIALTLSIDFTGLLGYIKLMFIFLALLLVKLKTIKIKRNTIISIGIIFICCFIFSKIVFKTHFFNQPYSYRNQENLVGINIQTTFNDDNEYYNFEIENNQQLEKLIIQYQNEWISDYYSSNTNKESNMVLSVIYQEDYKTTYYYYNIDVQDFKMIINKLNDLGCEQQ